MDEQPPRDTKSPTQSNDYSGWLEKYGGYGGIPLFQSWRAVWVSLDEDGMFAVYSSKTSKRPRVNFFMNRLAYAKERDDKTGSFDDWPEVDVDEKRCFVVATLGSTYYFIAKTAEEKIEWLEHINSAKRRLAPDDDDKPEEESLDISYSGMLKKRGGIGGAQPGETWHQVWVSLNNSWEMLKLYPTKPPESSKGLHTESSKMLSFTSGKFYMNYMLCVEDRSDEDVSSFWPDDVDVNRCFVIATPENLYYFIAETEEETDKWVKNISYGIEKFPDMQPTILEFMLHEPPVTDTTGTQISEDDIDMSLNPEKAGWLRKLGGYGGIPFFQSWRDVWVSIDKIGRMFHMFSDDPKETGLKPNTSFFINRLAYAKSRDDEAMPFSDWPVEVDEKRCFVVATHGSIYYFIAENEKEKNEWLMSINAAKTMSLNIQTSKEDDEHPDMRHSESDDISSSNVGDNIEQEETIAEVEQEGESGSIILPSDAEKHGKEQIVDEESKREETEDNSGTNEQKPTSQAAESKDDNRQKDQETATPAATSDMQ